MTVQDRTTTLFPTFSRAATSVHRDVTSRYVAVWCVAVTAFAVLHAAITVGASFWRYRADVAAHDATVAAIDRVNELAARVEPDAGNWPQIGPPALDLDIGAAVGQIVAATAAFGLLLAIALVLAAHGRRTSAYVAALVPALSVAAMAGVLARTSPMIPTATDASQWEQMGRSPEVRKALVDMMSAQITQDTATWWNWTIAAVVGALAVLAVHAASRGGVYATGTPRTPVVLDLLVVGLVVGAAAVLLGSPAGDDYGAQVGDQVRLLAVTLLVAALSARAAAASRIGTAVALSVGFLLVHGLLYAAFDRDSGASGGWGVGTGGPQQYASFATMLVLVVTPVIAWIAGAVWAHRIEHRAVSAPSAAA